MQTEKVIYLFIKFAVSFAFICSQTHKTQSLESMCLNTRKYDTRTNGIFSRRFFCPSLLHCFARCCCSCKISKMNKSLVREREREHEWKSETKMFVYINSQCVCVYCRRFSNFHENCCYFRPSEKCLSGAWFTTVHAHSFICL